MAKKKPNLDEGLTELKELILEIDLSDEPQEGFKPDVLITYEESSLILDGKDARKYVETQKKIIDAVTHRYEERISRKAVEKLIRGVIFNSLGLTEDAPESKREQRITRAIKEMRQILKEEPSEYEVYYPVEGIAKQKLPIKFGGEKIEFFTFDSERINYIRNHVLQDHFSENDTQVRERVLADTEDELSGKVYCSVKVNANDCVAAKNIARREIHLVISLINFYIDLVPYSTGCFAYFPGEHNRKRITIPCLSIEDPEFSLGYELAGPKAPFPLGKIREVDKERNLGFEAAERLLTGVQNKPLQEKILTSIQWAGRATTETRNEDSFLLYAISLESLMLPEGDKHELTHRLSTRVAHFLGSDYRGRKDIVKQVKELYGIRSAIVHNGNYEVIDTDLSRMRFVAKACIIQALTSEPFISMTQIKDFTNWFDEQVLSSSS